MGKQTSQEDVAGLWGSMEGPQEISDLEFSVSMTGYFSPAMFSCTGAGAVGEELGFHLILDLSGGSKNGS